MKVNSLEIYLFRFTQVAAFFIAPLLGILAALFIFIAFIVLSSIFSLIGFLALPLLLALIVFDFISDFSRTRLLDPVGRYIDFFLMLPDALWRAARFLWERGFDVPRYLFDYAKE